MCIIGGIAAVLTTASAARADDAAVLAAARRWETPRRVCQAMARARYSPPIEVARCARDRAGTHLDWRVSRGDAQATIGDESFYIIRLAIGTDGRVTAVESSYSQGGR